MLIKPKGMEQASTCPECDSEGAVSLEHQELSVSEGKLTIFNGFDCFRCSISWYQTIVVCLGEVVSNKVAE